MEYPGVYLTINNIRVSVKQQADSEAVFSKADQDVLGLSCMKLFQKVGK